MKVTVRRPIASQVDVNNVITKVVQSSVGLQGAQGLPGAYGATDETYNCSSSIAVANSVFISGLNTIGLNDSSSQATCDVLGVVISKPTSTTAVVRIN